MKLFLIWQRQNRDYDTYSSVVVAAPDKETARQMDPGNGKPRDWGCKNSSWCSGPEHVKVRYLGEASGNIEQGVICTSFNAG